MQYPTQYHSLQPLLSQPHTQAAIAMQQQHLHHQPQQAGLSSLMPALADLNQQHHLAQDVPLEPRLVFTEEELRTALMLSSRLAESQMQRPDRSFDPAVRDWMLTNLTPHHLRSMQAQQPQLAQQMWMQYNQATREYQLEQSRAQQQLHQQDAIQQMQMQQQQQHSSRSALSQREEEDLILKQTLDTLSSEQKQWLQALSPTSQQQTLRAIIQTAQKQAHESKARAPLAMSQSDHISATQSRSDKKPRVLLTSEQKEAKKMEKMRRAAEKQKKADASSLHLDPNSTSAKSKKSKSNKRDAVDPSAAGQRSHCSSPAAASAAAALVPSKALLHTQSDHFFPLTSVTAWMNDAVPDHCTVTLSAKTAMMQSVVAFMSLICGEAKDLAAENPKSEHSIDGDSIVQALSDLGFDDIATICRQLHLRLKCEESVNRDIALAAASQDCAVLNAAASKLEKHAAALPKIDMNEPQHFPQVPRCPLALGNHNRPDNMRAFKAHYRKEKDEAEPAAKNSTSRKSTKSKSQGEAKSSANSKSLKSKSKLKSTPIAAPVPQHADSLIAAAAAAAAAQAEADARADPHQHHYQLGDQSLNAGLSHNPMDIDFVPLLPLAGDEDLPISHSLQNSLIDVSHSQSPINLQSYN